MTDKIEREMELPAPVKDVWRVLTDPEGLSAWLADEVLLDLRSGGEANFVIGDEVRTGWVEEVSPPHPGGTEGGRLAFWWALRDEPATRVCFELTDREDGSTLLRIIESRPLEMLDLVGIPLRGQSGPTFGPALVAGGATR